MKATKKQKRVWEQITRETWCKGAAALTADGERCDERNPSAVKWCLVGWIWKTYDKSGDAFLQFQEKTKIEKYAHWNDDPKRTFRQVKAALRKADV